MGRAGRYTLAVMAWIAVYAGWSSVLGLVIAAATGERLDDGDRIGPTVGLGVSTLFTVVLPLVPTVVALWFNDWLRDGAPSRADRERARLVPADVDVPDPVREVPVSGAAVAPAATAVRPIDPPATRPPAVRGGIVVAAPLGVPEQADAVVGAAGFPVAPVLRGAEEAPAAALAAPAPLTTSPPAGPPAAAVEPAPVVAAAEPLIDPDDPLGVGDLGLAGFERG